MRLCLIAAAMLLSACQLAQPGKTPAGSEVNPVTTEQISVTVLDDLSAAGQGPFLDGEPTPAPGQPVAEPEAAISPADVASPPPQPSPPPKSASEIACEKGGGAWVAAGKTGTMSCQTPQRDGGKQCNRGSDCEGQCLARSQSCAPYAPLFGCNEVLQDNGQRVTLCIE
jgi:hypothetical protein